MEFRDAHGPEHGEVARHIFESSFKLPILILIHQLKAKKSYEKVLHSIRPCSAAGLFGR